MLFSRSWLALALALLPTAAEAVVIDDFTVGAITVATDGTRFDEATATQTGLATEHVALGRREFELQQVDSVVAMTVDTTGDGRLFYDGPESGINTFVKYASDNPVDLTADGANHLVLRFGSASFEPRPGFLPGFGSIDLLVYSSSGGDYQYVRVNNSSEAFNLAIPFTLLGAGAPGGFDPTDLKRLEFGTGNGNLAGTFVLDAIESAYVSPGDYNADGVVDAADYTVWRNFSKGGAYVYHGDGNLDGVVDEADYEVWRSNYTGGSPPLSTPEPAGVLLLLTGVLGGAIRRRPA